jgi:hypothetical protein
MPFDSTDYYSHEFITEKNLDSEVIASVFTTKTGTEYRVYFYPLIEYFDYINESHLITNGGYFFGFTKVAPNEDLKEPFDPLIMNTIKNVILEFYESQGVESTLVFHCSDDWGADKKIKRANRFQKWFEGAGMDHLFRKENEEIVVNQYSEDGDSLTKDTEYLSLIIHRENQNIDAIIEEFRDLKDVIIAGK